MARPKKHYGQHFLHERGVIERIVAAIAPQPDDRIVDLSYAAARAVGIHGLGKVKLEPVRGGDPKLARELLAQLQIPLLPNAHLGE